MNSQIKAALALAATSLVCACAVRSPDMYREDVRRLLETKAPVLQACYEAELQAHPDATGKVTVHFQLERDSGKVTQVEIDDLLSTPNRTLRGCVLESLQGLALAPPDDRNGDATFTWEFQLPRAATDAHTAATDLPPPSTH
jgi:hypothetical protein